MLFGFVLCVFFHPVHRCIGNHARNRYRVPDVRRQVNTVTLYFPRAAFAGGEVVFIGVIAFCKTASERPRFLVSGFLVLVRSQPGYSCKHKQSKYRHYDLQFHAYSSDRYDVKAKGWELPERSKLRVKERIAFFLTPWPWGGDLRAAERE